MLQPNLSEVPSDLLSVILSLSWSVQARKKGCSQLRFWWPPEGQEGASFRAVSTGTKTDKVPREKQKELLVSWFQKIGFQPPRPSSPDDITLEAECETYIKEEYQAKGHSVGTIQPIRQSLRRLREVLAKGCPAANTPPVFAVPDITIEVFRAAVPSLKLREKAPRPGQTIELKPKAWKNLLTNIRAFLQWEMTRKTGGIRHLLIDPTLGVVTPTKAEIKKSRPPRTAWPDEEFHKTLAAIVVKSVRQNGEAESSSEQYAKDLRFTLKLLRFGGMDVNDTFRLLANHIEENGKGRLWIKKLRGKAKINSGLEMIKQPISSNIEKELRVYWLAALEKGPDAFVLPWHERFVDHRSFRSWIWKAVQAARKRAGLPPRDIKSFRHTFTTAHLKRGKASLRQLREWLGHAQDSRMIEDTYDLSEFGDEAMD